MNTLSEKLDVNIVIEDWKLIDKDKIIFENEVEKIREVIIDLEEKLSKKKYLKNTNELLDFLKDTKTILIKTLLETTLKGRWDRFEEYMEKHYKFKKITIKFK